MPLLATILAALIALASPGGDQPLPAPNQGVTPIRVISSSHSIAFPEEIALRLVAESDSPITNVRLVYQLGRQDTRIYGYPEFTPSSRIDADFRIKTGGASFLPSGVDVTYYYHIGDADGNEYDSERYSLEYLNPRYDWQRYRLPGLEVLWHDRPASEVRAAALDVNGRLHEVRDLLRLDETSTMKAVILNGQREARNSLPKVSDAATAGHLYGGFAYGAFDVFVLVGLGREGMVHEMTHLLIDEALTSPLGRVPAWLNEGLAMYFEGPNSWRERTVLDAYHRGRLMPLRAMGAVPGVPSDVRRFYAQSWSVVDYMVETYGADRMTALLGAIDSGMDTDEAVRVAYDISLDELESRWKRQLGGGVMDRLPADPGTIGTSFIIGGAVVATLAAALFRWLRNAPVSESTDDQ